MNIGRTQWGVGGVNNVKYTHTHTQSVHRDTQDGWSLGQRSDALEHKQAWPPLIKLMGYELRDDAAGSEGSRQWQTHTCTHTHSVSFVIHRVDGASKRIERNLDSGRRGLPPIQISGL